MIHDEIGYTREKVASTSFMDPTILKFFVFLEGLDWPKWATGYATLLALLLFVFMVLLHPALFASQY